MFKAEILTTTTTNQCATNAFSVHCHKVLSWLGHKICNMRLATLIKIAMKVLLSHSRRHGLKLVIFFAVIHTEFVRLINHFFVRRKPHLYTEWLTDILNQGSNRPDQNIFGQNAQTPQ